MQPAEPVDAATAVKLLLSLHGLSVGDEEFERLVNAFPKLREAADRLYIPEARYAEPAPVFSAEWT